MIFNPSTLAAGAAVSGKCAYKRIDNFDNSNSIGELNMLPDGLKTRLDSEGTIVFADYPSGHQVRMEKRTTLVLSPVNHEHWFGSKNHKHNRFWCRLD